MAEALLLIDIQNDYFPGGVMELVGSPLAGTEAGKLLAAFRQKSLPVIHIQHISTRSGATKDLSFGGATVSAANVQTAFLAALNGLFVRVSPVEEICASL